MALKYLTSYIVTFGKLVQSINPMETHRKFGSIGSKIIRCLEGKPYKFQTFGRTKALVSNQPLTEIITRKISWG